MLKNRNIFTMLTGLAMVAHLPGAKFSYAVNRNKKILEGAVDEIRGQFEPIAAFTEYEKARNELCARHCRRGEDGEMVYHQRPDGVQEYDILDRDAFGAELEQLMAEHSEAIEANEKQRMEYDEFLDRAADVELHSVLLENLPEDITPDMMEKIEPMVLDCAV